MAKLNALMHYNGLKTKTISFNSTSSTTILGTLNNIVLVELMIKAKEAGSASEYAGNYVFAFDDAELKINAYSFASNYSSYRFGFTIFGLDYVSQSTTNYTMYDLNTNLQLHLKTLKITASNSNSQTGIGTIYIKYYQL